MIWRIAWRNLWRHRGRTVIMTSAVGVTYGLMLVSVGIGDDGHQRMLREAVQAAGGDVLIHGAEYWATRGSDAVIRDAQTVVNSIAGTDGIQAVMTRVIINGLASSSAGARPVYLQGIDPELETALRDITEDIVSGTLPTERGQRRNPIVLGSRMANDLDLELGDRVVITASDPDGELAQALFHVTGIIETGQRELDEIAGYTTIEAAQRAVAMEGQLTQIGLLAQDGVDAFELAEAVKAKLTTRSDLEVLSWQEAVPEMVGFVELDDAFGYIYLAVIFIVVLFSITNTFLMAVMERVRELGLLAALGLRGRKVGRLILAETLLLTVVAMSVGFALGLGGHSAIAHWGIPISSYGLEEIEISGIDLADLVIYSVITPIKWIVASVFVAVATIGAAVYPAVRASQLAPAEAMRFYE